jgi:hypothetical protein
VALRKEKNKQKAEDLIQVGGEDYCNARDLADKLQGKINIVGTILEKHFKQQRGCDPVIDSEADIMEGLFNDVDSDFYELHEEIEGLYRVKCPKCKKFKRWKDEVRFGSGGVCNECPE